MKNICFFAIFLLLIVAACKKDKNDNIVTVKNEWKIGDKTYVAAEDAVLVIMPQTSFLEAISDDGEGSTFSINFMTAEIEEGVYKLVESPESQEEISMYATEGSGENEIGYLYKGEEKEVSVSKQGGKISITLPEILVTPLHLKDGSEGEPITFSGSLSEK